MAAAYLLDVSYLASPTYDAQPTPRPSPPLSWWCAGELAQWRSALALRDAWAAAVASTQCAVPGAADLPASSSHDRAGYISLNDVDTNSGTTAEKSAVPLRSPSPSPYHLYPFPSIVPIRNRYFTTFLSLFAGCAGASAQSKVGNRLSSATHDDVTAALLQVTQQQQQHSITNAPRCYGGVLLAELRQDPAAVPWHVLSRSSGGCVFRVVMVFLEEDDDDEAEDGAASHAVPSKGNSRRKKKSSAPSLEQKERWEHFAVENGFECVFHNPIYAPHASTTEMQLEVVSPTSGRRGLLEASLRGSNRLYQLLCNTLWPATVRSEHSSSSANIAFSETQPRHLRNAVPPGNAFLVVGNNLHVLEHLFDESTAQKSGGRAGRHLRFFTKLVQEPAQSAGKGTAHDGSAGAVGQPPSKKHTEGAMQGSDRVDSQGASAPAAAAASTITITAAAAGRRGDAAPLSLVLVNKYYAAVAQPRLLQTALFSAPMQDVLELYWEQRFAAGSSEEALCAEAPALVLWPPSLSWSSWDATIQQEDVRTSSAAQQHVDAVLDVRNGYPPLEVILDAVKRRGCGDVVVVVASTQESACTVKSSQASPSLTPYEVRVCVERDVEVVDLNTPVREAAAEAAAQSIPVLCDEEDVCATRGLDRLEEILHCVQWKRNYPLPPSSLTEARQRHLERGENSVNSCFVLAAGRDAFEEEAWLRDVVGALPPTQPCPSQAEAVASDMRVLLAVAPSVVAAAAVTAVPDAARIACTTSCLTTTLMNSYFTADVQLHLRGGLWTHYRHPPSTASAVSICRYPEQLALYDGFIVVTSLQVLQHAAALPPGSSQLASVIASLARKAAAWMTSQHAKTVVSHRTDDLTDTPLTLLYVTDVTGSDLEKISLLDECLTSIVKAEQRGSKEEEECNFVPIEVVFANASPADNTPAAAAAAIPVIREAWDTSKDGPDRIREAFEQQLWPHRQLLPQRGSSHGMKLGSAVKEKTASTSHKDARVCRPAAAVTTSVNTTSNTAVDSAAAAPPSQGKTHADVMWVAPVVGCELPPTYLVDPETLRSVPLPIFADSKSKPHRMSVFNSPSERHDVAKEKLNVWMTKMKKYGHRLSDKQRQEQAAALALAMENMLTEQKQ